MTFSVEACILLLLTFCIISSNILILLVLFKTEMLKLLNQYFFLSLTISDLCIGLFIAPFSFWTSLFDRWIYGEKFCHLEAYLAVIFWIASVYSLTWLSIDHYVAIRKQERYESIMTRTRCVCWVVLIWIAAFSFCSPPIFGTSRARYSRDAFLCLIDWNHQQAYFITSGMLIIIPPFMALSFANLYVFTSSYRSKRICYEQCTESNCRPHLYVMNVIVGAVYVISWLPLCVLQLYEALSVDTPPEIDTADILTLTQIDTGQDMVASARGDLRLSETVAPGQVHFWLVWIAIGNSFWKFPVYVIWFHDFRTGLAMLCNRITCCCR